MAESAQALPRFLFWLDLETTGLHPRESQILELAYVLTRFAYPYERIASGSFLISGPGRVDLLQNRCEAFIQEMHERSGLRRALEEGPVYTLPSIESILLALADEHGWSSDRRERTVIAGSSVGTFDLQFVRAQMPRLAERLSHCAFDVSAVTLAARSLGMPVPAERDEAAHRALADVEGSIRLMQRAVAWLAGAHTSSRVGLVQDTRIERVDGKDVPLALVSIERGDLPEEGSRVVLVTEGERIAL